MDFGTLKTRVEAVLGRAPNDVAYELVTSDVNNRLRVRSLLKSATLTLADSVSLPADCKAINSVKISDIEVTPIPFTSQAFENEGTPRNYAVTDGVIYFAPRPVLAGDVEIQYYERLSDLSADSDTNDILTNYPQIYVYGTLFHHHALTQNAEAASGYWTLFDRAMKEAERENNAALFGKGPIQPKVRSTP